MEEKMKKILKALGFVAAALVLLWVFAAMKNGLIQSKIQTGVKVGGMDYSIGMPASNSAGISSKRSDMMLGATQGIPSSPDYESVEQSNIVSDGGDSIDADKKVIKTGNLNLKVGVAEDAAQSISHIARENGGSIFSSSFQENSRGSRSGYVTVKVPFAQFDKTFEEIKKIATQVVSESTNAQDVTEEYTDLQAQLKNKRAEEESFVAILSRAGEIDDVLKATREVARVRGEIERLEGRIKFLNSQTDMSTITVQLAEDVEITPVTEGWRPWQVVKQSVKTLLKNSQTFVDGAIRFAIVTLPALAVYLLIVWLAWIIGRKIYRKFKSSQAPQPPRGM